MELELEWMFGNSKKYLYHLKKELEIILSFEKFKFVEKIPISYNLYCLIKGR